MAEPQGDGDAGRDYVQSVNAIRAYQIPSPEIERKALAAGRRSGLPVERVQWVAIASAHERKDSRVGGYCVHTTTIWMDGEQPNIETLHDKGYDN